MGERIPWVIRLELMWRVALLLWLGATAAAFVMMAMHLPAPLEWRLMFSVSCGLLGAWPVVETRHSLIDIVLGRTRVVEGIAVDKRGQIGGHLLRLPDGTTAQSATYLAPRPSWISELEAGRNYRAVVSARTQIVLAPPTLVS